MDDAILIFSFIKDFENWMIQKIIAKFFLSKKFILLIKISINW